MYGGQVNGKQASTTTAAFDFSRRRAYNGAAYRLLSKLSCSKLSCSAAAGHVHMRLVQSRRCRICMLTTCSATVDIGQAQHAST